MEALGQNSLDPACPLRLGLVVCLQSSCVEYFRRFYTEVLEAPATASPLLFPETVFAAPASHVSTLLGDVSLVATLLGPGTSVRAQLVEDPSAVFPAKLGNGTFRLVFYCLESKILKSHEGLSQQVQSCESLRSDADMEHQAHLAQLLPNDENKNDRTENAEAHQAGRE